MSDPADLSSIRAAIDDLDASIIGLIAARQIQVVAAGVLKRGQGADVVRAPSRVEDVIANVRARAVAAGASPDVVEATYRAMIGAFIDLELSVHGGPGTPTFAETSTDDPVAARLLDDYFTSRALGFTTHAGGYRITHPDPALFTAPVGVFLVVSDTAGQPVGCGGIRRIDDVDGLRTYEVKHVWLDESARGQGWSRALMGELERRAVTMGAELVVLDTNASLSAAQHLYRTSGYLETAPYNLNKNATHWFKKRLS